jgi:hypothetical protein
MGHSHRFQPFFCSSYSLESGVVGVVAFALLPMAAIHGESRRSL